jgi:hypothetical protein
MATPGTNSEGGFVLKGIDGGRADHAPRKDGFLATTLRLATLAGIAAPQVLSGREGNGVPLEPAPDPFPRPERTLIHTLADAGYFSSPTGADQGLADVLATRRGTQSQIDPAQRLVGWIGTRDDGQAEVTISIAQPPTNQTEGGNA